MPGSQGSVGIFYASFGKRGTLAVPSPDVDAVTLLHLLQDLLRHLWVEESPPTPPGNWVKVHRGERDYSEASFGFEILDAADAAHPHENPGDEHGAVAAPVVAVKLRRHLAQKIFQYRVSVLETHDPGGCNVRDFCENLLALLIEIR